MGTRERTLRLVAGALVAAVALTLVPPATAGVVGWWRFEGTPGDIVGSVPNAANPGTHDGAGEGSVTYAATLPDIVIHDPISGVNVPNLSSLNIGGSRRVRVTDDPALDAPSFTIEAFLWVDQTNYQSYISHRGTVPDGGVSKSVGWQLDTSNADEGRARFDTRALANQTVPTGSSRPFIADGNWHHTAITFDGATRRMSYYLDGGFIQARTLTGIATDATDIAADLLLGGGGSGWYIDEVRYSNEVLDPEQFLQAIPEPATLTLTAFGLLACAWRRRKRSA